MSVSFGAKSYLQYIEYSTSKELRAKWYSTEEYERFKQVITRDVLVNSVKLTFYINGRHHELTAQDHIRCIGFESFGLDLGSYSSLLNDNCWIRQVTYNYRA
jgi:hypothetical protein